MKYLSKKEEVYREWYKLWMVRSCREHLVAFPTAERYHANPQPTSGFRLADSQLKAAASEVAADRSRRLWYLYAAVVGR